MPTAKAYDQSKLDSLLDHNHCKIRSAATTQSTSILPPIASSPSTITTTAIALSPHLDACSATTNMTYSTQMTHTTSLQEIFQHQLHILKQIKELTKTLCQLIDCLVYALTDPIPAPKPWKSHLIGPTPSQHLPP